MGLKRPIIYTGGTFDLFHAGHAAFLERCHELGDVVVSLNTDEFIVEYKGKAPVMTYRERAAVLLASKWVTAVVPNGADTSDEGFACPIGIAGARDAVDRAAMRAFEDP